MKSVTVCLQLGNFSSLCALAPTVELIEEFSLEPEWRALRAADRPVTPPPHADDPLAAYKRRRKQARDAWARREFERDCDRLGLDPGVTPGSVDAGAANLALQFLADVGADVVPFVRAVLERAFIEGKPIGNVDNIRDLINADGFDSWSTRTGTTRMDTVENELAEAGVYAAPAMIIDGEPFIGRQHFPLVRWMLSGRDGAPPV